MRILTGKYKGRNIIMPRGIRPSQNKVRKAVFDILRDLSGLSFLELFAGSGAIGFEALSRGVKQLAIAECNRECIKAIEKNIDSLKETNCSLYPIEAGRAIAALAQEGRRFDIIFLDPPYHSGLTKKTLQTLDAYDILAPYGLIVAQHFKSELLPKQAKTFVLIKQSRYADTFLSIFRRKE